MSYLSEETYLISKSVSTATLYNTVINGSFNSNLSYFGFDSVGSLNAENTLIVGNSTAKTYILYLSNTSIPAITNISYCVSGSV